MNYFADSAWEYLAAKIAASRHWDTSHRLLVTVPRLPELSTLALAETLASRCIADDVALTFKVADAVSRDWSAAGRETAARHGWLDEQESLTYWRHAAPIAGRTNLVVLCGADAVTDAGSLSDFHRCDPDAVWREQMQSSFRAWIGKKLQASGVSEDGVDLREFDRLLVPLVEHGRADLLSVGDWLEGLDLRAANSVREVEKQMLSDLGPFRLPRLV